MKNQFLTDEQRLRLYIVLKCLGDTPYHRLKTLGYFLTYKEIDFILTGYLLDRSYKSIADTLFRGKRKLKRLLKAMDYDDSDYHNLFRS